MRVVITIDLKDSHRDWVRDDAEWWLRHHARNRWRVREDENHEGHEVLVSEFMDSLDAIGFSMRIVASEHQGRLV